MPRAITLSLTAPVDGLFPVGAVPSAPTRRYRVLAAVEPVIPLPALQHRGQEPVPVDLAAAELELRAAMFRFGGLVVDVEHSGYPLGHRDYWLKTVQLGDDRATVVFDATDPAHTTLVRALLADAPRLYAHSAVADLVPLATASLVDYADAWAKMRDTVIPAKLADPASTGSDPGLKRLSEAVLGSEAVTPQAEDDRAVLFELGGWLTEVKPTTPVARSGWAQVNPAWRRMVRYAAADVLDTGKLARRLPRPSDAVLDRERAVQRAVARISLYGLALDGAQVLHLHDTHTAARARAVATAQALGIANPGSGQQVGDALLAAGAELPHTDTGRPSVAAGALAPLRDRDDRTGQIAVAVLDYRHHDTVLTTFIEPYRMLVEHGDGRVRPVIYTLEASTGRMTCRRPNLQQVSRTGGIRACIVADPGCTLVSADLSGIELRVAAALSGDPVLTQAVVHGTSADRTDIHWLVAQQVFGPGATKADRYTVKPGVYGYLYGGTAPTLAEQMGCDLSTAQAVIDSLVALTPRYARWAGALRAQVRSGRTTYPLYSGATLHLPRAVHAAPNYVIQRTARELLVDAILRWRDTPWGDCVLLPVHDELLVMVPESDGPAATATLLDCMHTEFRGVPVVAAADDPCPFWADAA